MNNKKLSKYIITIIIVIICIFWGIHSGDIVLAQTTDPVGSTNTISGWVQILETLNYAIYVLLRPVLTIAGLAMDNTLVTGSVFRIDEMLWKFRNIIWSISYMLLVVMIIYDIGKAMRGEKGMGDLVKKVPKYLIAGVMISASRWIVAALIDISTILTYQLGNLPISLTSNNIADSSSNGGTPCDDNNIKNFKPLLGVNTTLNFSEGIFDEDFWRFAIHYRYSSETFIACKMYTPQQEKKEDCTDVQKDASGKCPASNNTPSKNEDSCKDQVFGIEQESWEAEVSGLQKKITDTSVIINKDYCVIGSNRLINLKDNRSSYNGKQIVNIRQPGLLKNAVSNGMQYLCGIANDGGQQLDKILTAGQGLIGPMYTIYSNLLNFTATPSTSDNAALDVQLLEMFLKAIIGFLLFLPLLGLAIILVIRVGVLWIVFAFSPLIGLINSLGGLFGKDIAKVTESVIGKGWIAKFSFNATDILKLIFQPVVTVFALSLSIVFLYAIQSTSNIWTETGILSAMGINISSDCHSQDINFLYSDMSLKFVGLNIGHSTSVFFDFFGRIVINGFGIIVVRSMLMISIKYNSITGAIGERVEKLSKAYLGSRPIIPLPTSDGVKMVGRDGLKTGANEARRTFYESFDDNSYKNAIEPEINRQKAKRSEANANVASEINEKVSKTTTTAGSTEAMGELADIMTNNTSNIHGKGILVGDNDGMNNALSKLGGPFATRDSLASNPVFAQAVLDKGGKVDGLFGNSKSFTTAKKQEESLQATITSLFKGKGPIGGSSTYQLNNAYYYKNKDGFEKSGTIEDITKKDNQSAVSAIISEANNIIAKDEKVTLSDLGIKEKYNIKGTDFESFEVKKKEGENIYEAKFKEKTQPPTGPAGGTTAVPAQTTPPAGGTPPGGP